MMELIEGNVTIMDKDMVLDLYMDTGFAMDGLITGPTPRLAGWTPKTRGPESRQWSRKATE